MCDDNGERRGEAQWFQLASPRGATTTITTTTTISAGSMSIDIASISTVATACSCRYLLASTYTAHRVVREEKERERAWWSIGAIGRVATNREKRRNDEQQRVEERDGKKEHGGRSTHRERRLSLAGDPERARQQQ